MPLADDICQLGGGLRGRIDDYGYTAIGKGSGGRASGWVYLAIKRGFRGDAPRLGKFKPLSLQQS